jgi:hypothetical protein
MFGHGQIEGYTERYGMEYRRSYFDEQPDQWLVARHEREISPLLHRRYLFAEVRDFLLYDFYTDDGWVNEDVFAYSNQSGGERALVIYHNRYASTRGWIRISANYAEKGMHGDKNMRQRTLGEAFRLSNDPAQYVVFRDALTGLEYLHRSGSLLEQGMHIELSAYRSHVFLDWRDVRDDGTRAWGALCNKLQGRGVHSLDDELRALELEPVHSTIYALLDRSVVVELVESASALETKQSQKRFADAVGKASERLRGLLHEAQQYATSGPGKAAALGSLGRWRGDIEKSIAIFTERLQAARRLPELEELFSESWPSEACAVLPSRTNEPEQQLRTWAMLVAWAAVEAIGNLHTPGAPERTAETVFERMKLREAIAGALSNLGVSEEMRWRSAALIRATFAHPAWAPATRAPRGSVRLTFLHDPDVAWLIGVHEYEGARYLVREPFERLMWWMALPAMLELAADEAPDPDKVAALERGLRARVSAAEKAGYRVEVLLDGATEPERTPVKSR